MKKSVNGLLNYNAVSYWLASSPLSITAKAIFLLVDDDHDVKNYLDMLRLWQIFLKQDKAIAAWADTQQPSPQALKIISEQSGIVITTKDNLHRPIPSPDQIKELCYTLKQGQMLSPEKLIDNCVKLGFEPNIHANQGGEIARRGGLVDIGYDDRIVRVDFDGKKIDSLKILSLSGVVLEKNTDRITLFPTRCPRPRGSLIEYVGDATLLVSNQRFDVPQQLLITDLERSPDFVVRQQWPLFRYFDVEKNVQTLQNFKGTLYWLTKRTVEAKKFLAYHNISAKLLELEPSTLQLPPGWHDLENTILVINDNHLLPPPDQLSKKKRAWLSEIMPGDFVVHKDHGVGRLTKIKTLKLNDFEREYLIIEYAASDKIYLPTDQADKVSKYIGPANPKINRLSNETSWINHIKKVQQETWELAQKILNIEAARRLQTVRPLPQKKDEKIVSDEFPYQETRSQEQAVADALHDLEQTYPTERLICGDVGFGKTEIALRAAWRTILNGGQVALIAPTTILAQQHFDTFVKRLEPHGAKVVLLSRWQTSAQQTEAVKAITSGSADIVIGTHRVLSRDVRFAALRLLIIDEEQNFGVKDKDGLKHIAKGIHILSLSATPIPRTLHLALSTVRSISLLTEPPAGRQDIITEVLPWSEELVRMAIREELKRKGQVYYLYNKVETIDFALSTIKKLFPKARVAIAHGQMDDKLLADTMHRFDQGEIDVLVCSTIITNGLDLPNVNTIIVTDAANFGLGQLHQLRGRVGRSDRQAFAYFLYSQQKVVGEARERLITIKQESKLGSGFRIANRDMEIRGVGNVLGKSQHGRIKTIGLELYQELIEQSVNELRGIISQPWRHIDVELPITTTLPEELFPDAHAKIYFWQQLAYIHNESELAEYKKEFKKEASLEPFFLAQTLRIKAQKTDIQKITHRSIITTHDSWIEIILATTGLTEQIKRLLAEQAEWVWDEGRLKIKKSQLKKWDVFLVRAVELLTKS